jgi:hypothetical protein
VIGLLVGVLDEVLARISGENLTGESRGIITRRYNSYHLQYTQALTLTESLFRVSLPILRELETRDASAGAKFQLDLYSNGGG